MGRSVSDEPLAFPFSLPQNRLPSRYSTPASTVNSSGLYSLFTTSTNTSQPAPTSQPALVEAGEIPLHVNDSHLPTSMDALLPSNLAKVAQQFRLRRHNAIGGNWWRISDPYSFDDRFLREHNVGPIDIGETIRKEWDNSASLTAAKSTS